MKFALSLLFFSSISLAQVNMSEHEKTEQQKEQGRQELHNLDEALKPNQKSKPTTFDVRSLSIDPNLTFEITNHLLGYSLISENDRTLNGVKFTGFMNVAYYNVKEKYPTSTRSEGRFVVGVESPVLDMSKRSSLFLGGGATLGDHSGFYLDVGADFYLVSWFKIQGALNYTSGVGIGTMINAGFSW